MITDIDPKALQLTIILLRQYQPELAHVLPGPEEYPLPGEEVNLKLSPTDITEIISALNKIGQTWLKEKAGKGRNEDRDRHRQSCLSFLLNEWIKAGEQYQQFNNTLTLKVH
jgi:hypothetical protein